MICIRKSERLYMWKSGKKRHLKVGGAHFSFEAPYQNTYILVGSKKRLDLSLAVWTLIIFCCFLFCFVEEKGKTSDWISSEKAREYCPTRFVSFWFNDESFPFLFMRINSRFIIVFAEQYLLFCPDTCASITPFLFDWEIRLKLTIRKNLWRLDLFSY